MKTFPYFPSLFDPVFKVMKRNISQLSFEGNLSRRLFPTFASEKAKQKRGRLEVCMRTPTLSLPRLVFSNYTNSLYLLSTPHKFPELCAKSSPILIT